MRNRTSVSRLLSHIFIADAIHFNSGRGALSRAAIKNGCRPNPAHLLQLIIEMITVGAVEGYLVTWTMRQGCVVYKVQLAQGIVEAVVALTAEIVQLLGRADCLPVEPGFTANITGAILYVSTRY